MIALVNLEILPQGSQQTNINWSKLQEDQGLIPI
jgi:hypothetical protein